MQPLFFTLKKSLSCVLSLNLIFASGPTAMARSQSPPPPAGSAPPEDSYPGQGAPMSADELNNLVSPIALYPDALVAQILGASTFPDQVQAASNYLQSNKDLTGQSLMQAVDKQPWDPSVKALTQFPSVLENMAKNLAWTSQLGEASHNQQADVMAAVQHLRQQAQAAGNLKSTPQQTVSTQPQNGQQTIIIEPANPQVVYVPTYSTTVVYGTPYTAPGYTTADVVAAGVMTFGMGIAIGAMMSGGCCGWGWSSWNVGWYGGGVYYHGGAYYGNTAWRGGYYGTSGAAWGPNGAARGGRGYNPSTGTYARGGTVATPYGTRSAGQAYNPYTGAYGATRQGSNAYGQAGASTFSKNGQTVDTQHVAGRGGNYVGTAESSNGNRYATADGNAYRNTGNGVQKYSNGSWNNVTNSQNARGWGSGQQTHPSGSSAFSGWSNQARDTGSNGWGSREASSRGWASRGGGGGWGGGGFRGGRR